MAAWPAIANPTACREVLNYPQVRTEFENGYVQSRVKWTRARRQWQLSWSQMTAAHWATLETHFTTCQGIPFTWIHPSTAVSYNVRFQDDSIETDILPNGNRTVRCLIEEV